MLARTKPWIPVGLLVFVILAIASWSSSAHAAQQVRTRVVFNGDAVPVSFNDGDSFRILGGTYSGAQARLAGFNTLESHGPVHQWGTWSLREMYVLAKMAMYHGRKGVWHCESDGKTDTYGRLLAWCPDLAESLVRAGLAHVMSVDANPGRPELIEAQREAQQARRGMWAHGIPPYVLTSLHSVEEDTTGEGTYNRLVSTVDGHSVKWKHEDKYDECAKICAGDVDENRPDSVTTPIILAPDAKLEGQSPRPSTCMVHVPFERRYGAGRAACLR